MKKIVSILMLAAIILFGAMSIEAKTSPKKTKTKTTKYISKWNNDIPSAKALYNLWNTNKQNITEFTSHGYSFSGDDSTGELRKPGVCIISWGPCGSHQCSLQIEIPNTSNLNWLYKDINKFISSQGLKKKCFVELWRQFNSLDFVTDSW